MSLPPGQRDLGIFPRFGIPFWEAPPAIAEPALIRVTGVVDRSVEVPISRLGDLERCEQVADFHCVTGWSARGLRWGGVSFRAFYDSVIMPEAGPAPDVSHVVFEGADGYRSTLTLQDAFEEDVVLADKLGGLALPVDHGAPVRLLSPRQYAYKSSKHLCRIELWTHEPPDGHRGALVRFLKGLVKPHPRARVWEEERHRYVPAWAVRGLYRSLIRPWAWGFRRRSRWR